MDKPLVKERWSPYLVGTLIGVLSWLMFYFLSQHIGTTQSLVKITAFFEGLIAPSYVRHSEYFQKYLHGKPLIGWQVVFVIALFFGALLASKLSGSNRIEHVPTLWEKNFGPSKVKRYVGAFVGGFFLLFGARIASGCTSGHAISGGLQLALSGWVFIAALFASGILTAFTIYKKRG